jgi:hypothetical protein
MADIFKNMKFIQKYKGSDESNRMTFINCWSVSFSG